MDDPPTLDANDADAPLSSLASLRPRWEAFQRGSVASCPLDGEPMALAAAPDADTYRLVCVQCGQASPWFAVNLAQLYILKHGGGLPGSNLGAPYE